jgi:hypothetical protein
MKDLLTRWTLPLLALAVLAPAPARAGDEDDVRKAFADLQKALKAQDPEAIWPLLDAASQKAAEAKAELTRTAYAKAGAKDKATLQKALGLSADELDKLTGKLYLKSKKFTAKYDEIPGGKVTRATVDGDRATVFYTEPDGDKEKTELVRQDGKWKVVLTIP